ncbi:YesL family protein [Enterococcus timonensis]|uniref:YesL family protein n=1 Tax=Enterococcus timonensis TaxID=1852364 RepID=UPI0008D95A25|nr:YesL family protein [Enterococcus timonensis]
MKVSNLYTLLTKLGSLFILNLLFLISNLPLFILFLLIPFSLEHILFFFLASLTLGPSITALQATVGRYLREQDWTIWKTYFNDYRQNFRQAFLLGLIFLTLFTVIFVDILFHLEKGNGIMMLGMGLLLILVMMVYLGQSAVLGRFEMKFINLMKIAPYIMYRHFPRLFLSASSLMILLAALYYLPSIAVLVGFALCGYLMMKELNKMLKNLAKEFQIE